MSPATLPAKILDKLWRMAVRPRTVHARVACLGLDLYQQRYGDRRRAVLANQQKARVDLLMQWAGGARRPRAWAVKPFVKREDVFPLVQQQELLPILNPRLHRQPGEDDLLMDSFAELTDQKFTHRGEGWSFCCHYSDLDHNPKFESLFASDGLMPSEDFYDQYKRFFAWVAGRWPGKRVVFFHFPTALDNRPVFRDRGELLAAMRRIEKENPWVRNCVVDDGQVVADAAADFPYHYGPSTYAAFLKAWRALDEPRP